MRLFVALDIPEETRARLRGLISRFAPVVRGARFVRVEGIHVTLKFIGHVEDEKLAAIKNRLANVPQRSAISVAFRDFAFFPSEKRPRVFYASIVAGPELAALATDIETQLEPLKIPKENRAFTPHLTLARFKTSEGQPQLLKVISAIQCREFGEMSATEFHLYESVLKSTGAIYTKLASYSFVSSRQ